jgi:hypothetical protein
VNCDEAKDILLRYRHHNPADEEDPLVVEALALAKSDPELARWLEMHCARQFVLREKFRQIPIPEGLKEQIISEHAASRREAPSRRQYVLAGALVIAILFTLAGIWLNRQKPAEDTLAVFQSQMARIALSPYGMETNTSDAQAIRAYLKQRQSPADYVLSASLQQTTQSGCAIENWQGSSVSMVCFRTGRPMPAGMQADLWLFVVDPKTIKDAPADSALHVASVNKLTTATWVRDGKLYFIGLEGGPEELRKYL